MGIAAFTFVLVYLGMILGGLPYLQLDRTGVALLGAIAPVASGTVTLEEAGRAVHVPTLMLLFSFMVISAQLRLGGFYTWVTRRLAEFLLEMAENDVLRDWTHERIALELGSVRVVVSRNLKWNSGETRSRSVIRPC